MYSFIFNNKNSSSVCIFVTKVNLISSNSKIKTIYITNSLNKDVLFDHSNLPFNTETLNELKPYNLNQIGCANANATIIVDDEEKVYGNLMKTKIYKDSKSCSHVDITKSDGNSSLLLDEIEKVIKTI